MGTWICHLRIAEQLLAEIPGLDESAFSMGNVAPDFGIANEDGTAYDPPKEVTHFTEGDSEGTTIRDLIFYRTYLAPVRPDEDIKRYSFLLGYFFHLLTDGLWKVRIWRPSKRYFEDIVTLRGEFGAGLDFKVDWYNLDQCYVRDNPNCLFWRVFLKAPLPRLYLPYMTDDMISHQVEVIRKFYSQPEPSVLDRPYPYLNETAMSLFINDAAASILSLHNRLRYELPPPDLDSALRLLGVSDLEAFPPPLGD